MRHFFSLKTLLCFKVRVRVRVGVDENTFSVKRIGQMSALAQPSLSVRTYQISKNSKIVCGSPHLKNPPSLQNVRIGQLPPLECGRIL